MIITAITGGAAGALHMPIHGFIVLALTFICSWQKETLSIYSQPVRLSTTSYHTQSSLHHTVSFEQLSLEQGLPQSTVNAIMQDRTGFLWFGTQDGLCRYDGYTFIVYRKTGGRATSIADNFIQALAEDGAGALWVGTQNGGLHRFNPRTEQFTAFRHDSVRASSLPDDNITALCHANDQKSLLWVGTQNGGLALLSVENGSCRRYQHNSQQSGSLLDNHILSIYRDRSGTVWVGTFSGLSMFDERAQAFIHFTPADGLQGSQVQCIYEDSRGLLWVGTNNGLHLINRNQRRVYPIFSATKNSLCQHLQLSSTDIRALCEDNTGRLWIGTYGGGVYVAEFQQHAQSSPVSLNDICKHIALQQFLADPIYPHSLSDNYVLSILEDKQHTLWIGTFGGGVSKCDRRRDIFVTYSGRMPSPRRIAPGNVNAIFEDEHEDVLWIGTDRGLNKINRLRGTVELFRHNPAQATSLPGDRVNGFCLDRFGVFWVSTFGGGVAAFDRKTGKCTAVYKSDPNNPSTLASNKVYRIYEDKAGTLWVGTRDGGLHRFQRESRTFVRISGSPRTINDMYEDSFGVFWLMTSDHGLVRFDRNTGTFTALRNNPQSVNSISSNVVLSVYEDAKQSLWVATTDGLNMLDRTRTRWKVFREQDGLPNDVVYGIIPDTAGHLWFSTNKGLVRFRLRDSSICTYTVSDGLPSNEFSRNAFHRGHSGRLYFGGINGFSEFMPHTIQDDKYIPPVVLTAFKKFNKPAQLDTSITFISQITLDYDENFIAFEFAALNFALPEKNRYLYMMEGLDKQWVDNGTKREATFTNLDSKIYVFRVKAGNSSGFWDDSVVSVYVVVRPPWWKTWWFRTLSILLFAAGVITWYRLRVHQVQVRNKLLEQQVAERTAQLRDRTEEIEQQNRQLVELNKDKNEIMGIVAHDLKNPLSNIKMLAKLMKQESRQLTPAEIEEFATDIQTASERMFELISNLLNVNAIEQGGVRLHPSEFDLYALVQSIVHDYKPMADAKNIALLLQSASSEHTPALTSNALEQDILPDSSMKSSFSTLVYADRNATMQVVDNIVSNAIKYSPYGRAVRVRLRSQDNQHIRVEVQDEGPGLSDEDKKRLFGKFARLSAQPTGGEDSTGLGLSIVKKLVEAMNGRVWCESELGKGATFIVELPARRTVPEATNNTVHDETDSTFNTLKLLSGL